MKNQKGFTLIELLFVVFIIFIVLVIINTFFPEIGFIISSKSLNIIKVVVVIIIAAFLLNIIFGRRR